MVRWRGLQDGIDLPDELHANVQRRLGHNTSKFEVIGDVVILRARLSEQRIVLLVARRGLRIASLVHRVSLRCWLVFRVCGHGCDASAGLLMAWSLSVEVVGEVTGR